MCCCSKSCFSRAVVQALNIGLLIAGVLGVVFGIMLAKDELVNMFFKEIWIGAIALGVFLIVLAAVALCGFSLFCSTMQETKKVAAWVYILALTILILGQIGIVVIFLVAQSDLKKFLNDRWTNNLDDDQRRQIQSIAKCGDYESGKIYIDGEKNVLNIERMTDDEQFEDCYQDIKEEFTGFGVAGILIGLAVIALQVISLVASLVLACGEEKVQPVMAAPHMV